MNKCDQSISAEIKVQPLTTTAMIQLEKLQENDNEELEMNLNTIANSVCYLASLINLYQMDDQQAKRVTAIISDLAGVREEVMKLRREPSDYAQGPK